MAHKAGRLEQNVCFPLTSFKLTGYAHMVPLAKLNIMRLDWSVKSAVLMQSLAGMKIPFKPSENKTFSYGQ